MIYIYNICIYIYVYIYIYIYIYKFSVTTITISYLTHYYTVNVINKICRSFAYIMFNMEIYVVIGADF